MDDKGWRNLSLFMGLICAVLLGVTGALLMNASAGSTRTPEPGATSTAPVQLSGGPSPTARASGAPSAAASATAARPSASATARPKPTQSAPTATITFKNLMLDAAADPNGKPRTFTFMSDGPGVVSAKVVAASPQGTTKLCASVDSEPQTCWTGTKPGFAGTADTDHSLWTVTVIGVDVSTPTVDVTMTWPEKAAKVQLAHGRLQGQGAADSLNGFVASFKSRAAGNVAIQASWTIIQTDAAVTVADVTGSPAVAVDEKHYAGAKSLTYSHALAADRSIEVRLVNLSADQYRPDLSVSIAFP